MFLYIFPEWKVLGHSNFALNPCAMINIIRLSFEGWVPMAVIFNTSKHIL